MEHVFPSNVWTVEDEEDDDFCWNLPETVIQLHDPFTSSEPAFCSPNVCKRIMIPSFLVPDTNVATKLFPNRKLYWIERLPRLDTGESWNDVTMAMNEEVVVSSTRTRYHRKSFFWILGVHTQEPISSTSSYVLPKLDYIPTSSSDIPFEWCQLGVNVVCRALHPVWSEKHQVEYLFPRKYPKLETHTCVMALKDYFRGDEGDIGVTTYYADTFCELMAWVFTQQHSQFDLLPT